MVSSSHISLKCKNLGIGYSSALLPAFDLHLQSGQLIALVGSNGVGKSTFLRTISGFQPSINGQISWNENDLSKMTPADIAQLISVVTTSRIEGFNLRCRDVIASGRAPYTNWLHQLSIEDATIIDAAIAQCGLVLHQFKLIENLSDGLYQKTMIAKALAQQTPVILLDEPSAFLDYPSKHQLFKTLYELSANAQKLIIISTHDLDLVKRYCSHICLFEEGEAPKLSDAVSALQLPKFRKFFSLNEG